MSKLIKPKPIYKSTPKPPPGPKAKGSKATSLVPSTASTRKPEPEKSVTPKTTQKREAFALPAFSIIPKKPKGSLDWEDIKKKAIRRLAPEGEDIKSIRNIIAEIQNKKIAVHDFVNLLSCYTGDNGLILRLVLEEDVAAFRKLARKVYEIQTQDVSDVLVNEQLQLVNYYKDKNDILTDKMMRAINEIYEMAPTFDFERYFRDRDDYLNMIMPLPVEVNRAPEELEMMRRQMAYHRLQWLRAEGERMHEENKRLQQRLEQLKTEQRNEQTRLAEVASRGEDERQRLAKQEAEMKQRLQELNEDVEQSIIENEAQLTQLHRADAMRPREPSTGAIKKTTTGKGKKQKRQKKKPEWVSEVAADIEDQAVKEVLAVEAEAAVEPQPSTSRSRFRRPVSPPQRSPPPPKQASPFHFSPERTYASQASAGQMPPQGPPQQMPPRVSPQPPPVAQPPPSPQQRGPEVRIETRSSEVQERRRSPMAPPEAGAGPAPQQQQRSIPQPQQRGRRVQGPRDSWGGFF